MQKTEQEDSETRHFNEVLMQESENLQNEIIAQQAAIEENQKTAAFWSQRLLEMQEETQTQVNSYRNQCYKVAEQEIRDKIDQLEEHYRESENDYKLEYMEMMSNATLEYENQIKNKIKERNLLDEEIEDKKLKVAALVEEAKRQYEKEQQKDFYRLSLSNSDIEEIYKLREIIPYLRNPEPLNKVIWKVYYEKPYSDLIGRVIGSGIHTGIYKITNIQNQMCYVGQAANIADRWKTHIKRGIGAEPPINNKLYPAMKEFGVENFTFEIIEECQRNQLNDREDYWQDVFKAKEFGYSIK